MQPPATPIASASSAENVRGSAVSSVSAVLGASSMITVPVSYTHLHLRKLLAVKNHPVASVKYNEEKIHVGAVTVGGVTTGGAYKTGGDYSVREFNSERCELVFQRSVGLNFDLETTPIEEIYLSRKLVEKAKGTPVEKYIAGSSICVMWKVKCASAVGNLMRMRCV